MSTILFIIAFAGGMAVGVCITVTWYIRKNMEIEPSSECVGQKAPEMPLKTWPLKPPVDGNGMAPRLSRAALRRP